MKNPLLTEQLIDRSKYLLLLRRPVRVSTSFIQNRLKIGYVLAADLIDELEKSGVITPADHLGSRQLNSHTEDPVEFAAKYFANYGEPVNGPEMVSLNPMDNAPKDGRPVLLKFKDDLTQYDPENRISRWAGVWFVGVWAGSFSWAFDAPVGSGGFDDAWLEGWHRHPAAP